MTSTHVVVHGTLSSDGTLTLDTKLALPPGRVQLIVQPLPDLPQDDPFWQRMQRIWEGQKARGQTPRTKEEIDAQLNALGDEAEEEMHAIERLQRQGTIDDEDVAPES
ncbi:MAG TPA: hypothetical protein VFI31_22930 [Pirellulales bacterium]|nr:hypothetical protein [Pirellulales bacterium]